MKKVLLLSFFACLFTLTAYAQWGTCTPDPIYKDSTFGVYPPPFNANNPDGGIPVTACVGAPFEFVFNFKVPEELTFNGITASLFSVELETEGAVKNLPNGLEYACNPPDCIFTPMDTIGCVVLYGTVQDTAGQYDIKIQTFIDNSVLDLNLELPNPIIDGADGNYYLVVEPEGSTTCFVNNDELMKSAFQIRNVPNPFADFTTIEIIAEQSDELQFKVFDLLGKEKHQSQIQVIEGKNTYEFDGSNLSNGIYIYTIEKESALVSGRLVISK